MSVVIYLNPSSPQSRHESVERELARARDELFDFCRSHWLILVGVFEETGSLTGRRSSTAFASMVKAIRRGDADTIVCTSVNRLGRTIKDIQELNALAREGKLVSILTPEKEFAYDSRAGAIL